MYRHFPWFLAPLILLAFGCGGPQTYEVMGTQRDPGAEGVVQVESIEGGNNLVTVSFRHLTPPERLGNNLRRFVLWFRNPQGQATMASNLAYDPDTRTARATATTPLTRFVVIVTAEPQASQSNTTEPSGNVIFSQRIQAR